MGSKEDFIAAYQENIQREGAAELLAYLQSPQSDFFTAPASTRYHSAYEGGLAEHSLNVYACLKDYLERPRAREAYKLDYPAESVAIAALLHDLCKVNCYKKGSRNVKDEKGSWKAVATYEFADELPYGHGEKSVYVVSGFMRLTREEAFAIRYHMGFSGVEDARSVGAAFEKFPLAFALSVADMEATYFLE
jgi:hypothetical protein